MKVIVLNSKGGVGKSTTSVQIIAPFLYAKNNKENPINLIEFDDENEDCLTFENSDILNAKRVKISGNDLDSVLTDVTIDNDNLVVDIGGNKTTTYILESLENSGMINAFDLVVIPMTDGEQDCINAVNIYKKIRAINSDIRIVFALSRVNGNYDVEMQFLDLFGDKKGRIDDRAGYIEEIDSYDRNFIQINDSEVIKYSRAFGVTAYEMCNKDIESIKEELKNALKEKNDDKSKKISYKMTIYNKAINYKKDTLIKAFNTLDEVVC
jgi:hypothetical protein